MIITFTSTRNYIPPAIKKLDRYGVLKVLWGKYTNSTKINSLLSKADILLATPGYFKTIDKKTVDLFCNLKYIFLMSSGTDWVDLEYIKSKNIDIETAKGSNAVAVAEHSWALALVIAKQINTRNGKNNFNFEISGKTVGILGYGCVGKAIAKIGKGFGAKICYTRLNKTTDPKCLSKNEVLKRSDILFLCLPLNSSTYNYLGVKEFALVKKGAIIINTAREELVNNKAVIQNIKSNKIMGYGMDFDVQNPLSLTDKYRLLTTPHQAYKTKETVERMYSQAAQKTVSFINNHPNLLNE